MGPHGEKHRASRLAERNLGSHKRHFTHIPDTPNIVADALSRSVEENNEAWEGKVIPAKQLAKTISAIAGEPDVTPLG